MRPNDFCNTLPSSEAIAADQFVGQSKTYAWPRTGADQDRWNKSTAADVPRYHSSSHLSCSPSGSAIPNRRSPSKSLVMTTGRNVVFINNINNVNNNMLGTSISSWSQRSHGPLRVNSCIWTTYVPVHTYLDFAGYDSVAHGVAWSKAGDGPIEPMRPVPKYARHVVFAAGPLVCTERIHQPGTRCEVAV